MNTRTIYLATDSLADEFSAVSFENEQDVIDFCKKRRLENDEKWGWHAIKYNYR